jgi:hypothetical protein
MVFMKHCPTRSHRYYAEQPPWGQQPSFSSQNNQAEGNDQGGGTTEVGEDKTSNKANRFSKFAPDADLPPDEFRRQLKENMKADLERRRQNDPTRGNQPAKSYLDSL